MKKILDWKKYTSTAVKVAAEGIVMLKNDNKALPLNKDETVSVFGRSQLNYYKSGTGSGGMVNVSRVVGIVEGLLEAGVKINEELRKTYIEWEKNNPYDLGKGWGSEPWSQKEMPLSDEVVKTAAMSGKTAVVIIGRTAGEEQDAKPEEGSYLLTSLEKDMLSKVRKYFEKVIVLLNVGGLVDMSFVDEYSPDSVLYVWQGGMIGGNGAALVLTGEESPSGKLSDTIAYNVEDYPSSQYFGDRNRNYYTEDIFVGYRWFETFAKEKVRYPFGYGLSYTTFKLETISINRGDYLRFRVKVTNTGSFKGKEVVQLYAAKPQGKLGQPARVLCGFAKTKELAPGESQEVVIILTGTMSELASYDDSGCTGHPHCWVLEAGYYNFYIGTDVRSAVSAISELVPQTVVIKQAVQAMAPVQAFKRIRPAEKNGTLVPFEDNVPLSKVDEALRRQENMPQELPYTGDKGIKLADVRNGKNSLDEFIAQLSDKDLASIIRGEGMGSPRVTAGTASAFGGVTDRLTDFGIPAACCDDGPSGMRLDCGTKAFSLPNGTMIACTFNTELITDLFRYTGLEMCLNKVECLLGPGMNIHRHPLNGRNFEYFSEDPYLTGVMAAAELQGLHSSGVTGTLKHFCGNNQETNRHFLDSAVSERALREIYLKGFEIAVREGNADSIMTTYGSINGLWTAGNYDLNTVILRNEWGFSGFVMTDWWANINIRGDEPQRALFAPMAAAQNDVYMVCAECVSDDEGISKALADGSLTRAELQRNAANICRFIMNTNAMKRLMGCADEYELINNSDEADQVEEPVIFYELNKELTIDLSGIQSQKGENYCFALTVNEPGWFEVSLSASSTQSEFAQIPVTLFFMGTASGTLTWNGTNGKPVTYTLRLPLFSHFTAARIYFAQNGLDLHEISFHRSDEEAGIDIAFLNEGN